MSQLNVDTIEPEGASTTLTLGASGDTVTIPSGATIDASAATATGFSSGLASVQTFTSSGTWTRPSGVTKVIVYVTGAGGSGSGAGGSNFAGGAGGTAIKFIDVSSISTSTVTVGSGGAASSGASGNNGGASSWSDGTNTVSATGGLLGNTTTGTGGGSGSSGGDMNFVGGGAIYYYSGGASYWGMGQHGSLTQNSYGGMGGGAVYNAASPAAPDGLVYIQEYK